MRPCENGGSPYNGNRTLGAWRADRVTREEAEEYAKDMTYRDAVYNALQGKCIPYRKATLIKLYELLDMVEPQESEDKE